MEKPETSTKTEPPAGQVVPLSIRYLAEFLLRGGSIDSRFQGPDRALEGARIHRWLQKQGGPGYAAEVPLALDIAQGGFVYRLSGRADGVLEEDGAPVVDEIKTTLAELATVAEDAHPEHWAQGACYAHILCVQRGWAACGVRLTYCNVETGDLKRFVRRYTAGELAELVAGLLGRYQRWAVFTMEWAAARNQSLQALDFPFEQYREGQRKMAVACYQTFKTGGRLFCCAPTGIGKTLSTLFPALKAMGEGHGQRVFYLTAKTISRTAAEGALRQLRAAWPIRLHALTLTAKDKVCFLDQRACFPEACPYADGYYDRVNDAVYQLLQTEGDFSREALEAAAKQYRLCPYELSLDLATWCDCVVCDYNYLFDPVVHLQRFFEGSGGDYLFLVDEAHNLVDRSRDMYSAVLSKAPFAAFKKTLDKRHKALHKALAGVNTAFVALRKRCEERHTEVLRTDELPTELDKPLEKFAVAAKAYLEAERGGPGEDELLALYFDTLFYQRIAAEYADNYTTLIYRRGADVTARLFCMDAAGYLDESMAKGRAAVLFSATLTPLPYYRQTLGGAEAKQLTLQSPFPPEHLGLFVADGVSTKYADREASLPAVADLLAELAGARPGNYIAYFPSYAYMRRVHEVFTQRHPAIETRVQQAGMEEAAREAFLAAFAPQNEAPCLGFCVLGGVFAEGVDLPGERLIGTAVVGVGLPQMGPEPDALRDYFDDTCGAGFEYAYQYPGMNKVLQAAGRVIRSETDKGVVLLIDSRFTSPRYLELFPPHWGHWRRATEADLAGQLAAFWAGVGGM